MNQSFLLILAIIVALIIVLAVATFYCHKHPEQNNDNSYLDENGDHVYYERSIIEKKRYFKAHPDQKDVVRTFRSLLHSHKH